MTENLIAPPEANRVWSEPQSLFQDNAIRRPTLVVSSQGQVHIVWESNNVLYHTASQEDGWLPPRRLIGGQQPSLALDATGQVNLVFRNDYSGRDEIYHSQWQGNYWSLPFNISHTDGVARNPHLFVAPDGRRLAVWEDETPGYATLYIARQISGWQWQSEPIPDTAGRRPVAICDVGGNVHVVYQSGSHLDEASDIIYTAYVNEEWLAPQRISDGEHPADRPNLAIDLNGVCHVVWRQRTENGKQVMVARKEAQGWQAPLPLSPELPHTGSPALAIASRLILHSAWNHQAQLEHVYSNVQEGGWKEPELAIGDGLRVSAPRLATDTSDRVHAVWVCEVEPGQWALRYAVRQAVLAETMFLPLV